MKALAVVLSAVASLCFASDSPLVTVPQLPISRGHLDWRYAPQMTGFRCVSGGALAVQRAFAQIGYDEKNLHVRYRCPLSDVAKLQGEKRERDGAVWQDDAVELLLAPGQSKSQFYHFIVNCLGSRYDSRNGDWSCSADTSTDKSEWTCPISKRRKVDELASRTLSRRTPARPR